MREMSGLVSYQIQDFQCKQRLVYASSRRGLTGKRKDL